MEIVDWDIEFVPVIKVLDGHEHVFYERRSGSWYMWKGDYMDHVVLDEEIETLYNNEDRITWKS
jgi:hypothetical protein